jgi:hypothetical protein
MVSRYRYLYLYIIKLSLDPGQALVAHAQEAGSSFLRTYGHVQVCALLSPVYILNRVSRYLVIDMYIIKLS